MYNGTITDTTIFDVKDCVLIDFRGHFADLKDQTRVYLDLSAKGCMLEAVNNIYDILREAETHDEAKFVLIIDILHFKDDII